jgi:hypothetical protein
MIETEKIFQNLSKTKSDINEHLVTLRKYAEDCDHITEMGTRYVCSTWAFVIAKPKKVVCYDILTNLDLNKVNQRLDEIKLHSKNLDVDFTFNLQNVLEVEIEETDLLFIDTYHEYNQLKKELSLHSKKVKKYLVFHDTTTFGVHGETFKEPNTVGIMPAINEFLIENKDWVLHEKFENNNGLTILKKING